MSFLQPFLLIALPIASLPIIIHLINQRRYQTTRWGAMMFLLAANKMSRGYARLRQWLILAMRVLAVAALIFVISRPLAGGWLGFTGGGRPELTLILLDRSPSMQQAGAGIVGSKLETGRAQLARTLKTLGSARWVLIESGTNKPRELDSADALLNTTSTEPASVASDIPGMLQAAYDYIKTNKPGRTEVWLCSDIRENDWNPTGGRWKSLQDAFLEFPQGVRFHLLAYPKADPANHAIRVTDVRRVKTADAAEVLVSLTLTREGPADAKETIPVSFEIDGARSQVMVELNGSKAELKDHKLPVEKSRERGWGKVSIPADANIADNDFYFTFDQPLPRLTVVVAEDPQAARPLQLAASISPDPAIKATAEVVGPEQLAGVEWDRVALLLWQAQLPDADAAKVIQGFVDRGGQVIFFPPRRRSAARASEHKHRRRLLLRHDRRPGRFGHGPRRGCPLRHGSTLPQRRRGLARPDPATCRRRGRRGNPFDLETPLGGRRRGFDLHRLRAPSRSLQRGGTDLGPEPPPRRGFGEGHGRRHPRRSFQRARLRQGRRPGGKSQCLDSGNLAAFLDDHDGGDGG